MKYDHWKNNQYGKKHGMHETTEYQAWESMKKRCLNMNDKSYLNYGGRGIKVSEEWLLFVNFFKDMGLKPTPKHSLDRIDNNGNYEAGNCKWATRSEQLRNKRTNVFIEYNGLKLCVRDWSKKTGIHENTIHYRLKIGLTIKEILTKGHKHWTKIPK